jgi:hypothetical protein
MVEVSIEFLKILNKIHWNIYNQREYSDYFSVLCIYIWRTVWGSVEEGQIDQLYMLSKFKYFCRSSSVVVAGGSVVKSPA